MILTTSKFERLVKNRVAQEMMVQNVSLEKDLAQKQADITYLQNQINPHFLYNTLECIRGQALNEGMDDLADCHLQSDISFWNFHLRRQCCLLD